MRVAEEQKLAWNAHDKRRCLLGSPVWRHELHGFFSRRDDTWRWETPAIDYVEAAWYICCPAQSVSELDFDSSATVGQEHDV